MGENLNKQKIKNIAIIVAVCVGVIGGLIALTIGSYKFFKNRIATESQSVIAKTVDNAEKNNEINIDISEQEEQIEESEEEQTEKQESKELTAEEKKKNEEEKKKKEEEQKKKQEENKKAQSQGYPYWIKVNYTANTVTIYAKDSNGDYTVPIKAMICSTGRATPRSGVYKTQAKYAWKALIGSAGKYCTRITGQILFHSVPYLNGDKNKFEYWEYDRLGETRSLGCIRLTVADAKWIYDNCPIGTSVEFYSSSNPGPLGKPSAMKISGYPEPLRNWDPTDPDPNNPWKAENKKQEEEKVKKAAEEAAKAEAEKKAAEEAKKAEEEKNKVTVPDVSGKTKTQATELLKDLKVEFVEEKATSGTDGVIIKQSLSPGTKVNKQTAIKVTLRKVEKQGNTTENTTGNTTGNNVTNNTTNTITGNTATNTTSNTTNNNVSENTSNTATGNTVTNTTSNTTTNITGNTAGNTTNTTN